MEFIKESGQKIRENITQLMNKCLLEGNVPGNWNNSLIILLHSKGNSNN